VYAVNEYKRHGQQICFVTFYWPLNAKAVNMVASSASNSELSSVVIRPGSFHLLMSFMGAMGYIVGGSGVKKLWSLIHAV